MPEKKLIWLTEKEYEKMTIELDHLRELKQAVLEMADIYKSANHIKAGSVGELWKKIIKLASE